MFEHMIAEVIKTNYQKTYHGEDWDLAYKKPVHIRPSLIDRVLLALGDVMIRVGLKLKERPHASLTTEQAHAPNFLIML